MSKQVLLSPQKYDVTVEHRNDSLCSHSYTVLGDIPRVLDCITLNKRNAKPISAQTAYSNSTTYWSYMEVCVIVHDAG